MCNVFLHDLNYIIYTFDIFSVHPHVEEEFVRGWSSVFILTLTDRYSQFHKTLPRSGKEMHWISVRFYEMGDTYTLHRGINVGTFFISYFAIFHFLSPLLLFITSFTIF